ncbi:MAG: hypothetical protein AB7L70_06450 [Pyrinomonadaceae bacterium]
MTRSALTLTLVLLSSSVLFAQALPAKKPSDDPEALKKDAVAFLRETMADVNNLRTLENRISFSAELAGLMWFHDEKEARSLYLNAFGDFKQLLMGYDQQMNTFVWDDELDTGYYGRGGLFGEVTEKAKLMRRFQAALQVRQQMAMSLAEHDPELAFQFFSDTFASISNPRLRETVESSDKYFTNRLLTEVARTNPGKAAELAIKSIKDGINYQHIELLRKLYAKDVDKGAAFASAIVSSLKVNKIEDENFWVVGSFMTMADEAFSGSKKEGGKKPMLTESELRELADLYAQAMMDADPELSYGLQFLGIIEKHSPSRAVQIRNRLRTGRPGRFGAASSANAAANAMAQAVNTMANAANSVNSISERERREREARELSEKELQANIEKLANKELPKVERARIVGQAKRIVMQTAGMDKKVMSLSALAATVAKAGDKELAAEIMREARGLVNPLPKNYQDFLLTWLLAAGYAEAEPERAFPLLEETIMRANETLAAFIKVGEFIDVAGEMIDEGEVQVGSFGGGMIRGLTSELGMADATLRTLAKADFKKTRDLTSRFDRTEVRILAKMMILRAVLGEKKAAPAETPDETESK